MKKKIYKFKLDRSPSVSVALRASTQFPTLIPGIHPVLYIIVFPCPNTPTSALAGLFISCFVESGVLEQRKHTNVQDSGYSRPRVGNLSSSTTAKTDNKVM